ncbi:RbsD/FucU domain-containing protein [Luteipulveratus mongoliensis]|uniref:RbsD or FucU transport n=1 Tax=Luteipulveratus mongoliensis TaxID=571913 RepID=A0A0K1JGE3_9MICO|nr:RbsD/FucU domain-containing protein [Luteipulveratus mongoliensis]AKU15663.1 RbsD or FucU transport [Luteipulveratus mongoliensis]
MLRYSLIHPQILGALAAAGHGSTVLVADANYAHSTGTNPAAPVVQLNLAPGLVSVQQVLGALIGAAPFERARLMAPDDGSASPCAHTYAGILGPQVPVEVVPREQFKTACRSVDLALTIATGDDRYYANVLLTIGAMPPGGESS